MVSWTQKGRVVTNGFMLNVNTEVREPRFGAKGSGTINRHRNHLQTNILSGLTCGEFYDAILQSLGEGDRLKYGVARYSVRITASTSYRMTSDQQISLSIEIKLNHSFCTILLAISLLLACTYFCNIAE
jgi:hypothetical protein